MDKVCDQMKDEETMIMDLIGHGLFSEQAFVSEIDSINRKTKPFVSEAGERLIRDANVQRTVPNPKRIAGAPGGKGPQGSKVGVQINVWVEER